ncbi:hypothetical protein W02_39720 [Nitrospira sp. KM1]|uniref:hypothetical protein n=1 Tax=Nitrospira sp. KM1 TaxID=1936990 RepID=UPI0013A74EFE|nr:hypothetical protein [Nitrospira sp. KM1]BCA56832.1 hypothetical protein W02_39720 [Nitrospira sp. KM1]
MTVHDAERETDVQFQACVALQNKALVELRKARNFRLSFADYLWGRRLTLLYERYHGVSHEMAELQQSVAEIQRDLNESKAADHHSRIALLTNQLQGLALVMSEFRETLSSLSNQVIARRSLGISVLAILLVIPQMWLALRQVDISEGQDGVLARQDQMAREQLDIAKRQLTLSEKQEETNAFLLAKRANLKLLVNDREGEVMLTDHRAELKIVIENAGTKPVKGSYCHLLVPAQLRPTATGSLDKYHEDEIGDVLYSVFRCRIADSIAPRHHHQVGAIVVNTMKAPGSHKVLWEFSTEDGINKGEVHLRAPVSRK